jgi:electron transfer flavoprotein alpha/beta subunit
MTDTIRNQPANTPLDMMRAERDKAINRESLADDSPADTESPQDPDLGEAGKRALRTLRASLKRETTRRIKAEEKYNGLMQGIAQALVSELRDAKYIEVHYNDMKDN